MVAQIDVAPAANGTNANGKIKSRNQLRRLKHKLKKVVRRPRPSLTFDCASETFLKQIKDDSQTNIDETEAKMEIDDDMDLANVEYVSEQLDIKGPALEAFSDVFARFQPPPEEITVRVSYILSLSAQT